MPLYDFQCKKCLSITTRYRKMDRRNDPLKCQCGNDMKLAILSAPFATVQPEAHYVCPATGKKITSWRERKNSFAEHGLQEADPDQHLENLKKGRKRQEERQKIADTYLPDDLKDKLKKIGSEGENKFHVG